MQSWRVFFIPISMALVSACTAKVGSDTPNNNDTVRAQKPSWSAKIEGTWQSDCSPDPFNFDGSRIIVVKYQGANFDRLVTDYNDASCTQVAKMDHTTGTFEFIADNSDTTSTIRYSTKIDNATEFINGKLLFDGSNLLWSDPGFEDVSQIRVADLLKMHSISAGPNPTPAPTANCPDFSGQFQTGSDYFEYAQTSCSEVVWKVFEDAGSTPESYDYLTDGKYHDVGDLSVKAYFDKQALYFEYLNDQDDPIKEVWSFTKQPCSLTQPSGENYLMKQVYIDGELSQRECSYWSRLHTH